jgi:hypothetical protein
MGGFGRSSVTDTSANKKNKFRPLKIALLMVSFGLLPQLTFAGSSCVNAWAGGPYNNDPANCAIYGAGLKCPNGGTILGIWSQSLGCQSYCCANVADAQAFSDAQAAAAQAAAAKAAAAAAKAAAATAQAAAATQAVVTNNSAAGTKFNIPSPHTTTQYAYSVAAQNVYPGKLRAGVILPANQIGAGAINSGVTVPANQLSAGTISSGVMLPANQLAAGALPTNVTITAPQVINGKGPTGSYLSTGGVAGCVNPPGYITFNVHVSSNTTWGITGTLGNVMLFNNGSSIMNNNIMNGDSGTMPLCPGQYSVKATVGLSFMPKAAGLTGVTGGMWITDGNGKILLKGNENDCAVIPSNGVCTITSTGTSSPDNISGVLIINVDGSTSGFSAPAFPNDGNLGPGNFFLSGVGTVTLTYVAPLS